MVTVLVVQVTGDTSASGRSLKVQAMLWVSPLSMDVIVCVTDATVRENI